MLMTNNNVLKIVLVYCVWMKMTPAPFSLRPAVCSEEGQNSCKRHSYPFSIDTVPLLMLEPVLILAKVSMCLKDQAAHEHSVPNKQNNKKPETNINSVPCGAVCIYMWKWLVK